MTVDKRGGTARKAPRSGGHLPARNVRIASGAPGILGHAAGHVDSTPSSFTPSTVCSIDGVDDGSVSAMTASSASTDFVPQQPDRLKLSQAVAAMSSESLDSAMDTPGSLTSDSRTSKSSGRPANITRRPNVIRKHASQPNFGAAGRRPQTAPQLQAHALRPERMMQRTQTQVAPAGPTMAMQRSFTQMQPNPAAEAAPVLTTAQLQQHFRVGGLYSHNGEEMNFLPPAVQEQHFSRLRHSQSAMNPRAQMMIGPSFSLNASNRADTAGAAIDATAANGAPYTLSRSRNGSTFSSLYDGVHKKAAASTTAMMATVSSGTSAAEGIDAIVPMRSMRGMRGLEQAERGETMISLDRHGGGFETGERIMPDEVKRMEEQDVISSRRNSQVSTDLGPLDSASSIGTNNSALADRAGTAAMAMVNSGSSAGQSMLRSSTSLSALSSASSLDRQGTLLSASAHPARRSRELSRVLGNTSKKLNDPVEPHSSSDSLAAVATSQAILEHGRSGKARVELDMLLESDLIVEGGQLRGRMVLKIRKDTDKEGAVKLMQPKVRVVGFEELIGDDIRYIFYHQAAIVTADASESFILHGSPIFSAPERGGQKHPIYSSAADEEGYFTAKEGEHFIPFSLDIPVGKGAKGTYRGKHACVRYIAIGSVKLKSGNDANRSIAHFYRHIDLFPYLNPAVALSSAPKPIQASVSKGLFMGGQGKVHLTASLHRSNWVAGQRVYVRVGVQNETSKKIKSVTLALLRTLTLFRPREDLNLGQGGRDIDPDACVTSTSRKKLTEETLEMGQRGANGTVTARGWWTGVSPGGSVDFSHSMAIPHDALSIVRGRHVEVLYSIKVSLSSSMSSTVSVELPLRVINFVSLDPPPGKVTTAQQGWQQTPAAEAPLIDRVRSMEVLKSPVKAAAAPSILPPASIETLGSSAEPDDEVSRARRLQHQKSLDFIQHAIRSATARRIGTMPTDDAEPTGLGIAIDDEALNEPTPTPSQTSTMSYESAMSKNASISSASTGPLNPACLPYIHPHDLPDILASQKAVDIDDMDSDEDDEMEVQLNDDSIDEVDIVLGSARLEDQVAPAFGLSLHAAKEDYGDEEEEDREEDVGETTAGTIKPVAILEAPPAELEQRQPVAEAPTLPLPQTEAPIAYMQPENLQKEAPRVLQSVLPTKPASRTSPKTKAALHTATATAAQKPSSVLPPVKIASPKRASPAQRVSPTAAAARMSRTQSGPNLRSRIAMLEAASPAKVELKQKKSFTFATADAPVKTRSSMEALRAKVHPEQTNTRKDLAVAIGQQDGTHSQSSSNAHKKTPQLKHKKPSGRNNRQGRKASAESASTGSSTPDSQASSSPGSSLGPLDSASVASSSPASSIVKTPDTDSSCAHAIEVVHDGQQATRGLGASASKAQTGGQEREHSLRAFASPQKVDVTSRTNIWTTPQKPIAKLRGTVSMANMRGSSASSTSPSAASSEHGDGGAGLPHSSSTHNLRGAALVVPSVRNKIAALESRQATLRELTGAGGNDSDSCASTNTTPKAGKRLSTTSAGGAALTPTGRVAQLAASAEAKGSALPRRRPPIDGDGSGSVSGSPTKVGKATCSAAAAVGTLARKGSAHSVSSSAAGDRPEYLRRPPSVLSFKAPVFKPAHMRT
ncbi:hypothetical protein K437DRAFT_267502 [Tilletiaria anomala UBC 951]|uniref:Arrestin C-terminal-like domain-containing protein n=1 Tax=Tilletiaria anomala (strain ATCC 24038 / CBS 436.72 / UBC 951) TaxID=1037660 RepID=A0A066WDM9_TILAU|nr:uncharacterized protein K437DRAFT_267502 [Tilletiaria anomala UBC 951]KDN48840.1 hypothetical protein K437DRAFT_267502 [Tilletiaria anomala UBC 951]